MNRWLEGATLAIVMVVVARFVERRLLRTVENAHPAWSPDGTRMVFDRGRPDNHDIYAMIRGGSGLTALHSDLRMTSPQRDRRTGPPSLSTESAPT